MHHSVKRWIRLSRLLDRSGYFHAASALDRAFLASVRTAQAAPTPINPSGPGATHLPSSQTAVIHTNNNTAQQVLSNFMHDSQPVFFQDQGGQRYLIIHGSPAVDGTMYFDGGADGPITQDQLSDWMMSKGHSPSGTKILSCYGNQVTQLDLGGTSLTPAFDNASDQRSRRRQRRGHYISDGLITM
jgi:hypothetical protein